MSTTTTDTYTIPVPSGGCCCGPTTCCPTGDAIPTTLHVQINSTTCPAYDGITGTLTYDAGIPGWQGTVTPVPARPAPCDFGGLVFITVQCSEPDGGLVVVDFIVGGGAVFPCVDPVYVRSCHPLYLQATFNANWPSCCENGEDCGQMVLTVTE